MVLLDEGLEQKTKELDLIIKEMERINALAPKGKLRVSHKGLSATYYQCAEKKDRFRDGETDNNRSSVLDEKCYTKGGKYIRKKDMWLTEGLAQKEYSNALLKWALKSKEKIEELRQVYRDDSISSIYESIHADKRIFIKPFQKSDEEYALWWESLGYEGKEIMADQNVFITERGERVRSKSEKILADLFFRRGVPYKYEKPLFLDKYGVIYPDFTVLNKRTREEYYWEHLGMMDNAEYCDKAIKKIHTYEQHEIFPGQKLLLTYESKNQLNMSVANRLIDTFLQK